MKSAWEDIDQQWVDMNSRYLLSYFKRFGLNKELHDYRFDFKLSKDINGKISIIVLIEGFKADPISRDYTFMSSSMDAIQREEPSLGQFIEFMRDQKISSVLLD